MHSAAPHSAARCKSDRPVESCWHAADVSPRPAASSSSFRSSAARPFCAANDSFSGDAQLAGFSTRRASVARACTASRSGVSPCMFGTVDKCFATASLPPGSAVAAISALQTLACPPAAARWSAVFALASHVCPLTPSSSSSCTRDASPRVASSRSSAAKPPGATERTSSCRTASELPTAGQATVRVGHAPKPPIGRMASGSVMCAGSQRYLAWYASTDLPGRKSLS
mmetsp:Transcript_20944/g.62224  ORF Transcript_20944/g.62224 Transcript_20944/m.62224 type:complete len:227 (-) Transcript_20944:143-823(-)